MGAVGADESLRVHLHAMLSERWAVGASDYPTIAATCLFTQAAILVFGSATTRTWAAMGYVIGFIGWEFSWSCGIPLGGYPAAQTSPPLSYTERGAGSVSLTSPNILHAAINAAFDGTYVPQCSNPRPSECA